MCMLRAESACIDPHKAIKKYQAHQTASLDDSFICLQYRNIIEKLKQIIVKSKRPL